MKRNRGLSLLEVVIALAVVAVILAFAIPAVAAVSERVQIVRIQTALSEAFLASSRHAVAGGVATVLCPSRDQASCVDGHDWSHGWLAFADLDADRKFGAGDVAIHQAGAMAGGLHLYSSPGRPRLVFQPDGGNAGSNATFTVCVGGGRQVGVLALSNAGRFHLVRTRPEHSAPCIDN
ncbi:GspH/FimT family protein [Lysobacter sp. CA199]|uniref:GspH/FimT family protein n=1 Tax=Lysobacter sp. CA199 TaxID=3455608 RepID=UPI003F8D7B22